jgi:RNA polymerase sigma factor (sigma-70 family)
LAAVPSIGRASRIEGELAPEADATRALYEQYANQVFRYCLHQLGSREEAEDAVQSTFLNAFRGIKRGVVPDLEAAWLFKIAHNVCLSRRRSAWRRGRIESPADFEVIEELAPAPSRRADELIGLQDVLERLPETQRRAILLREWQGLSYAEIAVELELSQSAVETLIFRARRSLASGLEQPEQKKRRAARALDWGNVLAGLKTALVGGSAAAKIAATVAVVSATTVVAAAPVQQHQRHHAVPVVATPRAVTRVVKPAPRTTSRAPAPTVLTRARAHHAAVDRVGAVSLPAHAAASTGGAAFAPLPPVSAQPEPTPAPEPTPTPPPTPTATPTPAATPLAAPPPPTNPVDQRQPSSAQPVVPDTPVSKTPVITLAPQSLQPVADIQPVAPVAPAVQPTNPTVLPTNPTVQPTNPTGNGGSATTGSAGGRVTIP